MYSTEDFTELDKSNFKCYKFANGDIYYGEVVSWHPEKGIITELVDLNDEELKPNIKILRHGNGVQLFGVDEQSSECRYEGQWNLDKKEGRGSAHYKDGSVYEGTFLNDLFDGIGKFIWRVGHVYIGNWKEGRMNGEGEFKHQDGHILRGIFKNNYMYDPEKGIYMNPFLKGEDSEDFKIDNKLYVKYVEDNKIKFTEDNIKIVYGKDEIISLMDDTIQNNMTPLLIRSVDRMIKKEDIFSFLPYEYVEVDLKYYYVKLRENPLDSPENIPIYEEIKSKFIDAMTNGKFLILNFDDCQIKYEELFEPSLKEISGNFMFNPLMFTPKVFAEPANFSAHIQKKKKMEYNPNFRFIVYSRYLIPNPFEDKKIIMNSLNKKFGKSLPLKNMNVFILSKIKKKKVEEPVEGEGENKEEKKESPQPTGSNKLTTKK